MKQSIQRKISAYRQAKSTKQSFQGFIDEKKKNLKHILEQDEKQSNQDFLKLQKENKYTATNEFSKKMQIKQQEYFKQMQEIQNLKLQSIQKNNDLENLKIQLTFQRRSYDSVMDRLKQQKQENQELVQKIISKQTKELKQTKKVYEERLKKNFEHYEELLSQKAKQNERMMQFVTKRKTFQKEMKELKQNHEKGLKQGKTMWLDQQQELRQKWEQKKKQQIMENTLKGIEPEIQRIVGGSKKEIKKIQEKYQILKEQYRDQVVKEFQKKCTQMRSESFAIVEAQKMKTLAEYSQKLKHQFETLQQQFQKDRRKIRAQRQQQIRQLQQKRKNQTEQFISKNKDFYTIHLQQVKSIKEEYELQIKELDGKFQLEIQKEEDVIRAKYNEKLQREREAKRKQLENKIKAFTIAYEKESQTSYQDLVQKVAVDNDSYESQIRARTELKLKEMRQTFQGQTKLLRKTVSILQNKFSSLSKESQSKKQQRQSTDQAHQQMKRQNQYFQKKLAEYQNDLHSRNVAMESNFNDIDSHPQLKKIVQQWQEQINNAKQSYMNLKKQIDQSEQIMVQKISELRNKSSQTTNILEKNSLKLLNLKKNQVAKLKADKQMLVKYGQGLDEMIRKQKLMMEKFKDQQKNVTNSRKK